MTAINKSVPERVEEFRARPFSVPIGEGTFQGLVCPDCKSQRFCCVDCAANWVQTALTETDQQARARMFNQIKEDIEKVQIEDDGIVRMDTGAKAMKEIILSRLSSLPWFETVSNPPSQV